MKNKNQSGFTLMELMITVAIMGILSALVYPSYVKSVQKGKRSDAKVELLRIAQLQESFFAQNMSYADNLTTIGLSANTITSKQGEYDITISSRTPSNCDGSSVIPCVGYTLTATVKATSTQRYDTECPQFTLSSTGQQGTVTGALQADVRKCWK